MKTKEEFQSKTELLIEPINTFILENEQRYGLPTKPIIAYDRQEEMIIVQLKYADGCGFEWTAKTVEEMANQIFCDMLTLIEL